jgi:hypothetical protein
MIERVRANLSWQGLKILVAGLVILSGILPVLLFALYRNALSAVVTGIALRKI